MIACSIPRSLTPSYAMGATLAGCRSVPVAVDQHFRIDLSSVAEADARRALCLWVNTPGQPGRRSGRPASRCCLGQGKRRACGQRRMLRRVSHGKGSPVPFLSVAHLACWHCTSLSKRSNMAGVRARGSTAGDADLVHYLSEVRKHAGALVPVRRRQQRWAAWNDQQHVDDQRYKYRQRLETLLEAATASGAEGGYAGRRFLPVGAGTGRRCLGVRGAAGVSGWVSWCPPGEFLHRPAPRSPALAKQAIPEASCASRPCSPGNAFNSPWNACRVGGVV